MSDYGFGQLIEMLRKNPKKIVFTEGTDPRILEAASRLLAGTFLSPILVGNPDEIAKAAEESAFNIRGAEIIDPANFDRIDEMVDLFCELRKKKGVTPEQARETLKAANYFGTMLVKMGIGDALLDRRLQALGSRRVVPGLLCLLVPIWPPFCHPATGASGLYTPSLLAS